MSYINMETLLTGIWLQMCQTENTGLGVRRVPVSIYTSVLENLMRITNFSDF